jgi:hypothetical protein
MRTARSHTSGENFVDFFMAPSSQRLEPPRFPKQFILPFNETRAYVQRMIRLYGSVRHSFDKSLTEASPWLAATSRRH